MEIIAQLERTKTETLKYFDLDEEDLQKTYGPGKWSARYVLHHIADSESILLYRLRRIISEPKQVIWVVNGDAWSQKLDYSAVPLQLAKSIYISSREAIIYYARKHYGTGDQIKFVHSETGLRTLRDEFDKVVWHNEQHVAQIQRALNQLE